MTLDDVGTHKLRDGVNYRSLPEYCPNGCGDLVSPDRTTGEPAFHRCPTCEEDFARVGLRLAEVGPPPREGFRQRYGTTAASSS
jgi:hypothetical protein